MGLIREVQGVSASINRQERARREREKLKILQENYKKELKDYLQAEFLAIYRQNDTQTAEEITIFKKDDIVLKIYNELYNRHYLQKAGGAELVWLPSSSWDSKYKFEQKTERVFLYRDFDILTDLNENYYKILKTIQKEAQTSKSIENKRLLLELKKRIVEAMELNSDKYFLSISLKQNRSIKAIVNDITSNENEKEFLYNNYDRILNQVLKLYSGDIAKNKMEIKAEKEILKSKKQKSLVSSLITSYILSDISKSLPKAFNKKRSIKKYFFFCCAFIVTR